VVAEPLKQKRQAVDDPGLAIENSFLFARHANPNLELHDVELLRVSIIAVIMLGTALLALFLAWRRGRLPRDRALWISLALIPVAILFLQFPISLPVWNLLPKLRFLQFPWRWLVALEAPMAILFAAAIWPERRWLRNAVISACSLLFLLITTASLLMFHQSCDAEDRVSGRLSAYHRGQGFEGVDEYAPPSADNSIVVVGVPDACLVADATTILAASSDGTIPEWDPANGHCDATYSWIRRDGHIPTEHRRIIADTPHAGFLILHLREYAAWQVRVNDRLVAFGVDPALAPLPHRDDGMMAVPVPRGPVEVAIDWEITRDVILGRWLSALSVIFVIALCIVERRSSGRQDSRSMTLG